MNNELGSFNFTLMNKFLFQMNGPRSEYTLLVFKTRYTYRPKSKPKPSFWPSTGKISRGENVTQETGRVFSPSENPSRAGDRSLPVGVFFFRRPTKVDFLFIKSLKYFSTIYSTTLYFNFY